MYIQSIEFNPKGSRWRNSLSEQHFNRLPWEEVYYEDLPFLFLFAWIFFLCIWLVSHMLSSFVCQQITRGKTPHEVFIKIIEPLPKNIFFPLKYICDSFIITYISKNDLRIHFLQVPWNSLEISEHTQILTTHTLYKFKYRKSLMLETSHMKARL